MLKTILNSLCFFFTFGVRIILEGNEKTLTRQTKSLILILDSFDTKQFKLLMLKEINGRSSQCWEQAETVPQINWLLKDMGREQPRLVSKRLVLTTAAHHTGQ
jgi:hypothetical protein